MARLGPVSTSRRQPRKLGQLARRSRGVDWTAWWREWRPPIGRSRPSLRPPHADGSRLSAACAKPDALMRILLDSHIFVWAKCAPRPTE